MEVMGSLHDFVRRVTLNGLEIFDSIHKAWILPSSKCNYVSVGLSSSYHWVLKVLYFGWSGQNLMLHPYLLTVLRIRKYNSCTPCPLCTFLVCYVECPLPNLFMGKMFKIVEPRSKIIFLIFQHNNNSSKMVSCSNKISSTTKGFLSMHLSTLYMSSL